MPFFDDDSLGGLGGTLNGIGSSLNNASRNPLFLAGLQMLANGSPQINKIPNTLDGVPNLMLAAGTQQKKYDDQAANNSAMTQALIDAGIPADRAASVSRNPQAAGLMIDTLNQRKQDADRKSYFGDTSSQTVAAPQPQAPQQAPAPQQQAAAAPAPQPQQSQVVDPQQQALDAAAKKFDDFGLASVGKTVEGFAASLGDPNKAARFTAAAQAQGLQPNSPITGPVLSDPAKSGPLARAAGVLGDDVPDDQFQAAHAQALQVSRERQAARAAQQQQFQKNVQGVAPAEMVTPPQQAPAPQPAPTATERAVAVRERNSIDELQAKIAREERYLGSKDSTVAKAAAARIQRYTHELEQKSSFTVLGKDPNTGEEVKGFVDPITQQVTPYRLPSTTSAVSEETFPGGSVDERLQAVPVETRAVVRSMLDGRRPPPTGNALKSAEVQSLIRMAHRVDPDFDETTWQARQQGMKSFTAGKDAESVRAIDQTLHHMAALAKSAQELPGTGSQTLNKIINATKTEFGSEAEGNFLLNAHAVAEEMSKVYKGGNLSDAEIQSWEKGLHPNMSPEQQKGAIRKLNELLQGGLHALEEKRVGAVGSVAAERLGPLLKEPAAKKLAELNQWLDGDKKADDKPRRTGRYPGTAPPPEAIEAEMRRRGLLK